MKRAPIPSSPPTITDTLVKAIASAVFADPRSVVRRIAGLPVRGLRGRAIDQELAARGLRPGQPVV